MDPWKPVAVAATATLVFGAVGGLVGLARTVVTSTAALAVVALLVVAVLAATRWGAAGNRWHSTPYWGR